MSPGRPRSTEADDAILAAARALLEDGGYEAVTMEAVAARARVGKTTVYRRYGNRAELVADATMGVLAAAVPAVDRGSLRADLAFVLGGLTGPTSPRLADVVLRLATESMADERTRAILNDRLLAHRRAVVTGILDRARARGEVARPVEPDTVIDLIAGALLLRAARRGGPVDDPFRQTLLDVVVAGLTTGPAQPATTRRPRRRPTEEQRR
jgi:AcrR family transcriptional regulator